jgi:hypothetical protein
MTICNNLQAGMAGFDEVFAMQEAGQIVAMPGQIVSLADPYVFIKIINNQ